MKFQLASIAALAASVVAVPTPEAALEERAVSRLPAHLILLATLANGTIIGSLKGDGNFTTKRIDYPYRVTYTSGNNGNDGNLFAYSGCSIGSGPLDGAIFNCSVGSDQSTLGQFWNRDGFMSADGPTGVAFSINRLPDSSDSVGVPLIIGGSGAWGQFKLQAKSTSG